MRWIDAVKLFALGCLLGVAVGANARGQDDATRFAATQTATYPFSPISISQEEASHGHSCNRISECVGRDRQRH